MDTGQIGGEMAALTLLNVPPPGAAVLLVAPFAARRRWSGPGGEIGEVVIVVDGVCLLRHVFSRRGCEFSMPPPNYEVGVSALCCTMVLLLFLRA